jgi:hypothetical protein
LAYFNFLIADPSVAFTFNSNPAASFVRCRTIRRGASRTWATVIGRDQTLTMAG